MNNRIESAESTGSYARLFADGGFQAFLWTQFLGAFNDNVYKMIVSIMALRLAADSQPHALAGRGGGNEKPQSGPGEKDAQRAAYQRQRQAFRHQLPNDSAASGAERGPNRNLCPSRGGAGE